MIHKFSCKNFRNINIQDLQLERINLLIGPNNSGKTNFIKALTFYSDILVNAREGNLKTAFLNAVARNNWDHARNNKSTSSEPIEFTWDIILNEEPVRYKFDYVAGTTVNDSYIFREELSSTVTINSVYPRAFNYFSCHKKQIGTGFFSTAIQKGTKNTRLTFKLDEREILPMQFKDILLKNKRIYGNELIRVNIANLIYNLEDFFEGIHVYNSANFNLKKLREPADDKGFDSFLNADATNFLNVFTRLNAIDWTLSDLFKDKMMELIPSLSKIDCISLQKKLHFRMINDGQLFDLTDVSEGTLKAFLLNLLINLPQDDKQSVIAIDEPETNLHPAWQKVVGRWLQTSVMYKQCFISTHSPDFLDTFTELFKLNKVAVFVFNYNSKSPIKKITYQSIKDELGDWELGDLYRTNDPSLGGWPW